MTELPANTLYTDEDVDGGGIKLARKLGAQIVTAKDAGLLTAGDPAHFEYAIEHNYIMVTGNIRDFDPLLREWQATRQGHPGMIYITPKHAKSSYLIAEWLALYTYESMENRVEWI